MPTPSCLGQSRAASSVHSVESQLDFFACTVPDVLTLDASGRFPEDSRELFSAPQVNRPDTKRSAVVGGDPCNTATLSHE